jgi:hypothetical protein
VVNEGFTCPSLGRTLEDGELSQVLLQVGRLLFFIREDAKVRLFAGLEPYQAAFGGKQSLLQGRDVGREGGRRGEGCCSAGVRYDGFDIGVRRGGGLDVDFLYVLW